jgi:MoaA/NifB/PqqE/SkfB family radical SAM enzyme
MYKLKNKAKYLKGRCKLCNYKAICCGSMRVRALRKYNDAWKPDPQCYLTDHEIGLKNSSQKNEKSYAK